MADDGVARSALSRVVDETHAHSLRSGAAQAELPGEVAAERSRDEEQRLTSFHRRLELAMRARELRRSPGSEPVWVPAPREHDRIPARRAEPAFERARPRRPPRAHRAQPERAESFQLLRIA